MGATLSDCRERYRGLMDSLGDPSPEPDQSGSENKFRREGKVWRLSFDGKQAVLNHLVGLIYIQEILVSKAPIISSTELVAAAADPLPEGTPVITNRRELELEGSGTGYRGSVSDGKTVRECRARRKEIELEQAEAEEDGNCEAYDVLDHEAKKIDEYLRGALGLGGRLRDAPAENENVRKNVEKAIRRAREAIAEVHPSLAEHLRDSIDVGGNCAYLADPRPNWTT